MLHDSLSSPSAARPRLLGSIRNAMPGDALALVELLDAASLAPDSIRHLDAARDHLLVLDLDGAVRATALVVIDERDRRASLQLLVVDAALNTSSARTVEARMLGVAVALCEAYGCTELDVIATSRGTTRRRYLHDGEHGRRGV